MVSRLGRIVKERVREFADEAKEQLRDTLEQAGDDLDGELAGPRKRVDPGEAPPEPPPPNEPKP